IAARPCFDRVVDAALLRVTAVDRARVVVVALERRAGLTLAVVTDLVAIAQVGVGAAHAVLQGRSRAAAVGASFGRTRIAVRAVLALDQAAVTGAEPAAARGIGGLAQAVAAEATLATRAVVARALGVVAGPTLGQRGVGAAVATALRCFAA